MYTLTLEFMDVLTIISSTEWK